MGKAAARLNDQRRIDWLIGRGDRGPASDEIYADDNQLDVRPFFWLPKRRRRVEAVVAQWAGVTPTPSLDEILFVLRMAWSPATQDVLRVLLEAAQKEPGRAGFAAAEEAARRVYRDIWAQPRPKGGRGAETKRNLRIWFDFNIFLARARSTNLKTTKIAAIRAFVARRSTSLTVRALKEILGQVDRSPGKEMRERDLRHILQP